MEITLEQLLKGKGTIIKNKEYLPTRNYIEPFVDRMSKFTSEFICKAIEAPQLAREEDNKIYNRVWVQAVLPEEYAYENHKQSVNILYALDKQKPIVKLFKNTLNMACLNMCVFSPEYMQVSELLPESAINFAFVKNVMEMTDNTSIMLKKLADTFIDRSNMYDELGHWIDRALKSKYVGNYGTVKLAESTPIEAFKLLTFKKESPYYTEDALNCFDVYNAFTDIICNDKDKDLLNKYEKVLLVSEILGFPH